MSPSPRHADTNEPDTAALKLIILKEDAESSATLQVRLIINSCQRERHREF